MRSGIATAPIRMKAAPSRAMSALRRGREGDVHATVLSHAGGGQAKSGLCQVRDLGAMQATGSGQRHAGLTRLRFFLISWVILYHLNLPLHVTDTWTWLGPVLWRGYLGVDGFFLLSGFALWLGYGARPPRGLAGIGRFLLRRVAKIWPLHAVALLGLALLVGLAMALGVTIREPERFGARDFVSAVVAGAWLGDDGPLQLELPVLGAFGRMGGLPGLPAGAGGAAAAAAGRGAVGPAAGAARPGLAEPSSGPIGG